MTELFKSVIPADGLTVGSFFMCFMAAVALGFCFSCVHRYKTRSSQSFLIALTILPAIVTVVILMVNGNVGTGVAVAGAFSLTRFRSQPGSAKEIGSVFMSMMIGLCCGTGYIGIAVASTVILSVVMILLLTFGYGLSSGGIKELTIVIPENLDYSTIFDDLFEKYTTETSLVKSRTCNMGSMYKLKYEVKLKDDKEEKQFIDEIRTRNGNLEVMIGRIEINTESI